MRQLGQTQDITTTIRAWVEKLEEKEDIISVQWSECGECGECVVFTIIMMSSLTELPPPPPH